MILWIGVKMLVYQLGSKDSPLEYVAVDEFFLSTMQICINSGLVPFSLGTLLCCQYDVKEFTREEIIEIYKVLEANRFNDIFDVEVFDVLKKFQYMLFKAMNEHLSFFAIGD